MAKRAVSIDEIMVVGFLSPNAGYDENLPLVLIVVCRVMIAGCRANDCGRKLLGCSRVMSLSMKD